VDDLIHTHWAFLPAALLLSFPVLLLRSKLLLLLLLLPATSSNCQQHSG
jgi:hypothetical protein